MDVRRIDAWLVKGFDGVTNLVTQRAAHRMPTDQLKEICDILQGVIDSASTEKLPTLDFDDQLFSTLRALAQLFVLRVQADRHIDSDVLAQLQEYTNTLKKGLKWHRNLSC